MFGCVKAADSVPVNPLALPQIGSGGLRIITPSVLELGLVTTKAPDPARAQPWDFVGPNFELRLPTRESLRVLVDGKPVSIAELGFKRRALYAPLKKRDLRIGNWLYMKLARPAAEGQTVEVKSSVIALGSDASSRSAKLTPDRRSPAIHVNQTGYAPAYPKTAMVGYYLGSLGELDPDDFAGTDSPSFSLVSVDSGERVFSGPLVPRPDRGFTFPTYQRVLQADFGAFKTPGQYRLLVPGLGVSWPFWIDEGVAAAFARTYALGLYHQRCGAPNELPFTRFVHDACHTAPAEVPAAAFEPTRQLIKKMTEGAKSDPRHTARHLESVETSLFPFVRRGKVSVTGGHHDAGDYSKYTINSAALIHALVFAADVFPGAGELDNLGIPESGDGKSDLLQEAKWEADFLAKMQDDDGGFHFLVYPKERPYEDDVLPDKGDPQVLWPKNTSASAAAVAALAQASSSPLFKKQFPDAARLYWEKARKGWAFLENAIVRHGRDGSYQRISHYGHEFFHDDELAWAAVEMFAATGNPAFARQVMDRFDPAERNTKRWTWWRMYEGYGCAIRSYAFAAKTGRLKPGQLDSNYLARCQSEILAAGRDQARFARECAYGSSFPDPSKRFRNAGWYFSMDQAFDLAVASQLEPPSGGPDPRPAFLEAIISNLNYEGGCNPVNVSYLTGLGWKRPREIVNQFAQNDRRTLPPSGIPIGNIQAGFQFLHHYGRELGALSFPPDGAERDPYPFYDRWGDSFNVTTEFVISNQGRGLAVLGWLMAQTPAKDQRWKPGAALSISTLPSKPAAGQTIVASVRGAAPDLHKARIVWEAHDQEPAFGREFRFTPRAPGDHWIEVEAQWPDGRRAFGAANVSVLPP
jgi:hypothetical protein